MVVDRTSSDAIRWMCLAYDLVPSATVQVANPGVLGGWMVLSFMFIYLRHKDLNIFDRF